jgi:dTDP-3-amino-3,4,6-trideoxy-alpha-D-glucose transaminase
VPVPLMDPHSQVAPLLDRVTAAMQDVVRSGRFVLGPRVAEAEERLADRVGAAHGVGVANGTDALVIALEALGIERGDEVICPSFTFFATAEAIARAGAVPVFADIDPATFCLDPEAVAAAVTPRTRAVCAVHLFGHPADAPALRAVCERHGLALLEDAAQAIGARLGDELCGSMGDAATFSFYPTKNLPCFGDGGLITTSNQQVAEVARLLRFHGSRDKVTFDRVGFNSRLDELQAAVLLELEPQLDEWNDRRIAVAARYAELGLGELVELPAVADGARHVYHLFVCRTEGRDALKASLRERGIGATSYYDTPLHRQPAFAHLGVPDGALPETERASRENLMLPMFVTLDEARQAEVVAAVRDAAAVTA